MLSVKILGVRVDRASLEEAVELVGRWVRQDKKRYIATINPEFVMLAQKDEEFKKILNQADLAICDGIGLAWAIKRSDLTRSDLLRVTGTDLMLALIKKGYKTVLTGGFNKVAEKAGKKLGVVGMSEPNVAEINKIKPDLLFVALGMGKQEKWIVHNLPKLKVKVAMGVGGALDQVVKPWLRAPLRVQALGLEWLWRLMVQPWRIKRQLALVKFIKLFFLDTQ
ncbi:MAG: WecB/TagA/CpsF family glycosyltransferase [Candidatus Beckwithbacteria bacterium]|nr:WecB/TagA/CpsF family glycosyltransferase [Candidatus Beckwithbacteria bacterium]